MGSKKSGRYYELTPDSPSRMVYDTIVEVAGVNVAMEFFRRYEGTFVHFCKLKTIDTIDLQVKIRKEWQKGRLTINEIAKKFDVRYANAVSIIYRKTRDRKLLPKVAFYDELVEFMGEKIARELFFRMNSYCGALCRIATLLKKQRNEQIFKERKKDKNYLAKKWKLSYHTVYTIIREEAARRGVKLTRYKRW